MYVYCVYVEAVDLKNVIFINGVQTRLINGSDVLLPVKKKKRDGIITINCKTRAAKHVYQIT